MNFENIKEKIPTDVKFETRDGMIFWCYKYHDDLGDSESPMQEAPFAMSTNPEMNRSRMLKFRKELLEKYK